MNPLFLRYAGLLLAAVVAGAGGGYLAVNNRTASPPAITQSVTAPAIPAQPFLGQGIPAIPAIPAIPSEKLAKTCPSVPYHKIIGAITSISGITANTSLYPSDITGLINSMNGNGIQIRSLFKTTNGVLLAAGRDYLASESRYIPVIYRSTDQGKTWNTASVPGTSEKSAFVNEIAEDATGVLWAVGIPGVMKSADGGMTWIRVNVSFTPYANAVWPGNTYRDFVRNVLVLKDNSILITVPFYDNSFFYAYTNAYKSTDGGNTWSLLFNISQVDILEIVEAQDGELVFTDQVGNNGANVYRFAQGTITSVLNRINIGDTINALLKTRNGMLYWVIREQAPQGGAPNTVYRSQDNGLTWRKVGELPLGSEVMAAHPDGFTEGSDGRLYLATWTNCWAGAIYQSSDQGRKWEVASGNVPGLSAVPGPQYAMTALEEIGGKVLHGGFFGGVIFTTP